MLTLPHPRAAERAFVLVPWWSVDPEARLAGHGSVLGLMQALPAEEVAAVRLVPAWSCGHDASDEPLRRAVPS